MKSKEIDITGKRFFLLTTWIDDIKELDVIKETKTYLVPKHGMKINKRDKSQFTGESKKEVKDKFLILLNEKLKEKMNDVWSLRDKIDRIKALSEEI